MTQDGDPPLLSKEGGVLQAILGLKAWRVWIDSDFQVGLLTLSYSVLTRGTGYEAVLKVMLAILLLASYLALGVLTNDYFDLPFDKLAGKERTIYYVPEFIIVALILGLAVSSLAAAALLTPSLLFLGAYVCTLFLAIFYSAPPLRLKERGLWGIACASVIEKPLPSLLVFILFEVFSIAAGVFLILMLVLSLEIILHHQLLDYDADHAAGLKTFTVQVGREKVSKILNSALRPVTTILLGTFALAVAFEFPVFTAPCLVAVLAYVPLRRTWREKRIAQFRKSMPPEAYFPQDPFVPFHLYYAAGLLTGVFPSFLALMLAFSTPPLAFLLAFVLASQYHLFQAHYVPMFRLVTDLLRS